MPRIKISLPETFLFHTSIPVRITDLNYGGHVGNDALLSILHEVRLQFLKSMNYSEMNFAGTSLIMADVAIEFKSESFYGDTLLASVGCMDISRVGFDLVYKVEKTDGEKLVPVAYAKTGMVCFNYESRKVSAVPEAFLERING
jgi:acyl-CoA thioesterase FadM